MHRGLWIVRKNHLCCLIKRVSEGHGGDEIEFLREHCRETINACPDENIEAAISCYEGLVEQLIYYPQEETQ